MTTTELSLLLLLLSDESESLSAMNWIEPFVSAKLTDRRRATALLTPPPSVDAVAPRSRLLVSVATAAAPKAEASANVTAAGASGIAAAPAAVLELFVSPLAFLAGVAATTAAPPSIVLPLALAATRVCACCCGAAPPLLTVVVVVVVLAVGPTVVEVALWLGRGILFPLASSMYRSVVCS